MKHQYEGRAALILLTLLAASACGKSQSASAPLAYVSQDNNDVQLLQMWTDKSVHFVTESCDGRNPNEGETVIKDCSRQAAAYAKVPWSSVDSPAVNLWEIPTYKYQGQILSRFGSGSLVEIRILIKKSVLDAPSFSGVGFYCVNNIKSEVRTIAKEKLHIVNSEPVRLKGSGEEGAVLRFVAYMPGIAGNSSTGWAMDALALKPFAEFKDDTNTYQNWENVPQNHRVYRYRMGAGNHQITSIDRQADLLQ